MFEFSYYTSTYSGTVDESVFDILKPRVLAFMSNIAGVDMSELDSDDYDTLMVMRLELCFCELIDAFSTYTQSGTSVEAPSGIQSESIGGWNVTYSSKSAETTAKAKYMAIYNAWLGSTTFNVRWC